MRWNKISDAVIRRLPLYLRVLDDLAEESEAESISSQELGVRAGVGPAPMSFGYNSIKWIPSLRN